MFAPYRNFLIVAFISIGLMAYATIAQLHKTINKPSPISEWIDTSEKISMRPTPTFFESNTNEPVDVKKVQKSVMSQAVESVAKIKPIPAVVYNGISGVTAYAYVVGNVETGQIYLEHNSSAVLPVASMSKLVTAFVATNELDLDKVIEINETAAAAPPDKSGIKKGERFTVRELLQPLLLSSSNVAAEALLSSTDRTKFLELMSGYSWEIGMPSTYFADPSGVNPKNIASARDLFALAKYLYNSRSDILSITRTVGTDIGTTTEHDSHLFVSTHPFSADPRFLGGKTGRTPEAGDTMLTILKLANKPIAIVVLGSKYEGRAGDTKILAEKVEKMLNN